MTKKNQGGDNRKSKMTVEEAEKSYDEEILGSESGTEADHRNESSPRIDFDEIEEDET